MADESNMGERIIKTPYDASQKPTAELGYAVPRIKLVGGNQEALSVPTIERLAQLQEAESTGHVVIPDVSIGGTQRQISNIERELRSSASAFPAEVVVEYAERPSTKLADTSKNFRTGSPLRKVQEVVVAMYQHLDQIAGLTREQLDSLLIRLSSSDTQEAAEEEITTGLIPVYETLKRTSATSTRPESTKSKNRDTSRT